MTAEGGRLKVGIVGASIADSVDGRDNWAIRSHIPALKALAEYYEITAVCTTRMETAEKAARQFGVPHAFDGVRRMVTEVPDLDVVCVAIRPTRHREAVMGALAAGKHVYCEHPMGVNTAEAQEMYDLAKEKGVRTMVGHQRHNQPATLHMAELVREGFIGRPLLFNQSQFVSNYIVPRPSHRAWLFQSEAGGHPAYRSGHSFDLLKAVLGRDVVAINADLGVMVPERRAIDSDETIKGDQVDNMNFLLRLEGGVMGTLQVSFTAWYGTAFRLEIYGSEGMLLLTSTPLGVGGGPAPGGKGMRLYGAHADIDGYIAKPESPERMHGRIAEIAIPERHIHVSGIDPDKEAFAVAQAWYAFAGAIREGRECGPNFQDRLKMHYTLDASERSVAEGSTFVDVDYSGL